MPLAIVKKTFLPYQGIKNTSKLLIAGRIQCLKDFHANALYSQPLPIFSTDSLLQEQGRHSGKLGLRNACGSTMHCSLERSLFKFNRNKHNRSVKGDAESTGNQTGTNSPTRDKLYFKTGLWATALSPPVRNSLPTHFSHPLWQPDLCLISQLPLPSIETNHCVKTTSELFLPKQPQNIKLMFWKAAPFLEKFYDLVTAACAAPWPRVALGSCQTMKQCYY